MFEAFPSQVTPESLMHEAIVSDANKGAGGILHLMHDGVVKPFPSIPAMASAGLPKLREMAVVFLRAN